jgi:hypothetical protein
MSDPMNWLLAEVYSNGGKPELIASVRTGPVELVAAVGEVPDPHALTATSAATAEMAITTDLSELDGIYARLLLRVWNGQTADGAAEEVRGRAFLSDAANAG